MSETEAYLKRALEHAPVHPPGQVAKGLHGWVVGPERLYVCARCANRSMGRGCDLPAPATPIWEVEGQGICVTCE